MDVQMRSYTDRETKEPVWDFIMTDGELKFITSPTAEEKQRAVVAAFLQKGTIPQLPDTGTDWAGLLTDKTTAAQVRADVLDNIHNLADTYAYAPVYSTKDNKLIVSIEEI